MSDEKTRVQLDSWEAAGNPRYTVMTVIDGPIRWSGMVFWFRAKTYALAFARRRGWEVVE